MASIEAFEVRPIDADQCEAVWPLSIEAGWNQSGWNQTLAESS